MARLQGAHAVLARIQFDRFQFHGNAPASMNVLLPFGKIGGLDDSGIGDNETFFARFDFFAAPYHQIA